jgi:hypothetical protein
MKVRRSIMPLLTVAGFFLAVACTPPSTGGGGGSGTTTTTVPTGLPVAIAGATPTIGDAPLTVQFDSTGSIYGTGVDLTFEWDFGDGSPIDGSVSPSHVYTSPGNFVARLRITTSKGTSTSPGISITSNVDPNPKFYVRPTGSTGAACGPKANPCSTIVEAQTNAVANGIHLIRVAGGNYTGTLALASNMEISGGWKQDFSGVDSGEVTTIFGTSTSPAVTMIGISGSKIAGLSAQGVARTSGDAVGVLINGSTGVTVGDLDVATIVGGGSGPNATGILVSGSLGNVLNTKVNSGTSVGAGRSAYGIRALALSTVNVTLSEVAAQPGIAGTSAPAGAPAQATAGCNGGNGGNAGGPSNPGVGGVGGGCAVNGGGRGGDGGNFDDPGQAGSTGGGGGGAGGRGGSGSNFGCAFGGSCWAPDGGSAGGVGAAGSAGAAGTNALTAANDLWSPTNGSAGTAGANGRGGGGGGGGASASASGGGGGGGGAGGNGGAAGAVGGTSGGGSFGIYANAATVNLNNTIVTASNGGVGGAGAAAGRGGNGGNGGNGGGDSCCSATGGAGGAGGGAGGGGGGAGGGAGGPSIAVYHVGIGSLSYVGSSQTRAAIPAAGGAGGAFAAPATSGVGGFGNEAGDGQSAGASTTGPAGATGPAGQLSRIWDNGPVVS